MASKIQRPMQATNSTLAALCVVALAFPAFACADNVTVGEAPPDYIGVSTDGDKIRMSDSTGRIQIISFWATWCGPCRKELPVLNAIQNQVGHERMRVVAVNLEEPRKQFRRAMLAYKEFNLTFVHDKKGITGKKYGVKGIPFMVILDVDGRVAYKHTGYNESALDGIVDEINGLLIRNQLVGKTAEQPGDEGDWAD